MTQIITVQQYAKCVNVRPSTVIGWIRNNKPMPGVVNMWSRPEGYAIQFNGDTKKVRVPLVEGEFGHTGMTEREWADYIIQRRKLRKRLADTKGRYWIVPEHKYTSMTRDYTKMMISEYIKAGVKLPGVEKVFKMTVYYLQLKKGYDFTSISDEDLAGIRQVESEIEAERDRKEAEAEEQRQEDLRTQADLKYYKKSFTMFDRAKKLSKNEEQIQDHKKG